VALTFNEFDEAAARMAASAALYTTGGRKREYRDHRLEWMIKSGGMEVVLHGRATTTSVSPGRTRRAAWMNSLAAGGFCLPPRSAWASAQPG
jgi:hypothetical protein